MMMTAEPKIPQNADLTGVRVLAALNGLELFGHERGNIEVFKTLRNLGAEVLVGINARDGGGVVGNELARLDFNTFLLPFGPQWSLQFLRKHPSMAFKNPWAILRCSLRFRKAIADFRPTHIHLGSPLVYSYVSIALAITRVPMIYRMGDCAPVASRFNLGLWRMAIRRAFCVVAISDYVRRSAAAAGANPVKIQTIHSAAPTHVTRPEEVSRMDGESAAESARLVYVGAVAEHKGLLPLVRATTTLARERSDVRLDIVGGSQWDREFRNRLSQLIADLRMEDHIALRGNIDDPTPYYRRAAVHIVPSLVDEGLGNVVIEAKREGTPSVVFPSGGLPETVNHKIDGYICSERSAEALIEALRWMFSDGTRLRSLRTAARADHDARFGAERFAREWASVYRATELVLLPSHAIQGSS